ncbi:hypothetical protein JC525_08935 [Alteromonas sp. IB21]|uniref:hypothetical protein n=1 Tax=Alteromonas sp. IB21 TaxID=2779369 RepID=UPI0018E7F799|nr:hypothetical protein [Alteromonas sp. IB21]MBJ2129060.1 hypothetical protein [Alteromonas sp. IB21]
MPSRTQTAPVLFRGGLNLGASVLEMEPGEAIQLFNYEVNTLARYQRILGYERFDGRPAPSQVLAKDLPGHPFSDDVTEFDAVQAEKATRRSAIDIVPGSGPIRGVVQYKDTVYAFRDNAAGTECVMYKSSNTGWQVVTTPTLNPGGRYEFAIANFAAGTDTIYLYGVDGKNDLFEFTGTTFTQLAGPFAGKYPTHIEVLSSQIMVNSYEGGTFVTSKVGTPGGTNNWNAEIGCGDEITALDLQANNSMAVFCRNRTYVLYGTSIDDFQLQDLSKTTGAVEWSAQTIGDSIYLDDRGMTRLNRVQEFGNFDMATMSQKVEPFLNQYARRVTASFAIKEKNQVRWCFDDGTGLICTFFGREVAGFSTFDFGKVIRCAYSGEDENGKEVLFFGSDDGFVYQMERGFSFDGNPIGYVLRPAFAHFGAPDIKKRWRKVVIEADTVGTASVTCIPDFDYSEPDVPYHRPKDITITGGGGYWDEATWDESRWSAASVFTSDFYIDGVSRNVSMVFSGSAATEPPHIVNSMIVHFTPRGRRR